MRFVMPLLFITLLCASSMARAQGNDMVNKIDNFPNKFFGQVNRKTASLDKRLDKQTQKYLGRMARMEAKLRRELYKVDSAGADYLFFRDPEKQYGVLAEKEKGDSSEISKPTGVEYFPYSDSLQGALSYLDKNPSLLAGKAGIAPADIQNSLIHIRQLQGKIMDAEQARQYIVQRKEQIKQYVLQHAAISGPVNDVYNEYNKQLYYYTSQLQELKRLLSDPDRMLKVALRILNKIPTFATFMHQNSFLTDLFNVPGDYDMLTALPGMQTRDMINQVIQAQVSAGGPNAAGMLSQNLQSVQEQFQQLKNKIASLGAGGQDADLPENFKPNNQKTKSVLQRLEYGTNMQTTQSSGYFPTTMDLGLSIGYKLSNKTTVGVGASYKVGLGTNISHINISAQGASLRSFFDLQVKGSFSATGGFEYNYQPVEIVISTLPASSWRESGLVGLSKTVSLKTKLFKKTKIQLLWDFLSSHQLPRAQPVIFRVNYNF